MIDSRVSSFSKKKYISVSIYSLVIQIEDLLDLEERIRKSIWNTPASERSSKKKKIEAVTFRFLDM